MKAKKHNNFVDFRQIIWIVPEIYIYLHRKLVRNKNQYDISYSIYPVLRGTK